MTTRQERLFEGLAFENTRVRLAGKIEVDDDGEFALGDLVSLHVEAHVSEAGVLIEKDGARTRFFVLKVNTAKIEG